MAPHRTAPTICRLQVRNMTETEVDIQPAIALFYTSMRQVGAPPVVAASIAVKIVTADIYQAIALDMLDNTLLDQLNTLIEITETVSKFADSLRIRLRLLNIIVLSILVLWILLVIGLIR